MVIEYRCVYRPTDNANNICRPSN